MTSISIKHFNNIMAESRSSEPIQLEPFVHQVGGHSSMLCLDDVTVCKPMIRREVEFYKSLPSFLKPFVPEFKGVIQVSVKESCDGFVMLSAFPPKHYDSIILCNSCHKTKPSIRLHRSNGLEVEDNECEKMFEDAEERNKSTKSSHAVTGHNPWVLKCHRDHLRKMVFASPGVVEFILLENLTWKYRYPCILDLKMGVRQYGDDASPAKKQRQKDKVATSTSSKLGVRICGMQVYQLHTGKFICHNKYHGRSLTVEGFKGALRQYLHNGVRLRTDLIPPMIQRLGELKEVIEKHDGYRFYTSSLLVLYDGREEADDASSNHNVSPNSRPTLPANHMHVCELARSNSIDVLQQDGPPHSSSVKNHVDNDTTGTMERSQSCDGCENGARVRQPPLIPKVDVRMIDFAHSTHSGFKDELMHTGPDKGYVLGLENVIAFLESIARES